MVVSRESYLRKGKTLAEIVWYAARRERLTIERKLEPLIETIDPAKEELSQSSEKVAGNPELAGFRSWLIGFCLLLLIRPEKYAAL